MKTFDYIVVGAGSAGCAVAARLSEDPSCTVLLIEAGGHGRSLSHIAPAAHIDQFHGKADWDYMTEPEPGCDGRRIYEPRGKVVGGCSAMNVMIWTRGNPADYDGWGVEGWGWDDVRPVYERIEQREGTLADGHGAGPMRITRRREDSPLSDAFVAAAAKSTGASIGGDLSSHAKTAGYTPQTIVKGRRWHTGKAYLQPAKGRKNLTLLTKTLVHRVVLRDGRAVGVELEHGGRREQIGARREVVLSAGAFNTPHLLQLSGVGDADHLRSIGVEPRVDNPAVGANLAEHPLSFVSWETRADVDTLFDIRHPKHLLRWLAGGRGILGTSIAHALAHVTSDADVVDPDLQLLLLPLHTWFSEPGVPAEHDKPAIGIGHSYWTPKSRGWVRAVSSDPTMKPAVKLNLLTEREDVDAMIRAIRLTRRIAATDPLASMLGVELHPGKDVQTDEQLERWLRQHCEHTYHPSCTARIGAQGEGVVDPQLRVHGVDGLRVADVSVLPSIPRANTNPMAIMVGERCAEFVRAAVSTTTATTATTAVAA